MMIRSMFSFLNRAPEARQISCGITHTIRGDAPDRADNLGRSAMYGGHIEGVGPRYCPSIEDKVVRFADKTSHQVFLEPEGLDDHTVYPNGLSTSLPEEVQHAYIRTIRGLEQTRSCNPAMPSSTTTSIRAGCTRRWKLRAVAVCTLPDRSTAPQATKRRGTRLVAGLNAAAASRGAAPIEFSRTDSYIGVMIDDLTSRGVTEPYRMFTSRAEFRLTVRADNADQRLTPVGIAAGCVSQARRIAFETKLEALESGRAVLSEVMIGPKALNEVGIVVSRDGGKRSAYDVLSLPGVELDVVGEAFAAYQMLDRAVLDQLQIDSTYDQYSDRQAKEVADLRRQETQRIPAEFDYVRISGLSNELKQKLVRAKPETILQASRIEGVTPAALLLILAHMRKPQPERLVG
jgi:tRNA uridine 5-carboxymethylaminomethyl modification enzyme